MVERRRFASVRHDAIHELTSGSGACGQRIADSTCETTAFSSKNTFLSHG